jgi:inosine-uridine nucleoside N-ribohydrolase
MMASPQPLVIDCDPGIDDAIALLLAIASPELDILGITTVAGNVPVAVTQGNARRICELAQRPDLKVYAGCARPLLQPPFFANEVHGSNGLGGVELPEPKMPLQAQHGVDGLIEIFSRAAEPIVLATLGPLTNVAVAMVKAPEICQQIREIVIMGGARGLGNVTPSAEFNFFVDPHAAQIVFSSGLPITVIGLDVTHQALATPPRLNRIRALGNRVSEVILQMLPEYGVVERDYLQIGGPPLHDPCVIAYLLQPDLFEVKPGLVTIETASSLSLGRSVIDLQNRSQQPTNAQVAIGINADGFYQRLTGALGRLP